MFIRNLISEELIFSDLNMYWFHPKRYQFCTWCHLNTSKDLGDQWVNLEDRFNVTKFKMNTKTTSVETAI